MLPPPSHSLLFSGYLSPPPASCCLQEHSEIPRKANLQRTCCWWVVQGVAMFRKRHPSRATNCSMSNKGCDDGHPVTPREGPGLCSAWWTHWHLKSCFRHTLLSHSESVSTIHPAVHRHLCPPRLSLNLA